MVKQDVLKSNITKTRLYNFDPLKPHFYMVKLGFTGVYIIFLISAQNIDCGYSLEPPRRGGSNEYPQSIFWAEIWKISEFFYLKNFLFLEVNISIYLNTRVFVMSVHTRVLHSINICRVPHQMFEHSACSLVLKQLPRDPTNINAWTKNTDIVCSFYSIMYHCKSLRMQLHVHKKMFIVISRSLWVWLNMMHSNPRLCMLSEKLLRTTVKSA